jgi:hypothetical protein
MINQLISKQNSRRTMGVWNKLYKQGNGNGTLGRKTTNTNKTYIQYGLRF